MCDSALTLAESDKESRRAFLTLESSTGLRSSSACLFLRVVWHVTTRDALRRNPVRELRDMAVKRANAGVKKYCWRACMSTAWKEEGGDLGLVVPERFLAAEEAWDHWLT